MMPQFSSSSCQLRYFLLIIFFVSSCQFMILRAFQAFASAWGITSVSATHPFWSQDIHSHFPFTAYDLQPDVTTSGHYMSQSAFKLGYQVDEGVSRELVRVGQTNYTGSLYGIMIDAGSTGTRLSVFHFVRSNRPPFMRLVSECGKHVKPGLSYYAGEPSQAVHNLEPLIARAKECVPHYLWKITPLELKATAGLRLLPAMTQDRILDVVKQYLRSQSPFVISHDDSVSIMEGIDEGIYSWITVNYLLDTLHHKYDQINAGKQCADEEDEQSIRSLLKKQRLKQQTFGTLDLGGGSMQITFVPIYESTLAEVPDEYIHTVRIFGEHLTLYSWSYLGFGLMSARMQMFGFPREDPREVMQFTSNRLSSPCLRSGLEIHWQHGSTDYLVVGSDPAPYSSPYAACYARALEVVTRAVHYHSEVAHETFYIFSYFYDIAVEAEIIPHVAGGRIRAGLFKKRAEEVCDGAFSIRGHLKPFICMDLVYISTLLLDGFGFQPQQEIILQKKIEGVETSWALGAMFHLLNTFHNTSQLQLGSQCTSDYTPNRSSR